MSEGKQSDIGFFILVGLIIMLIVPFLFGVTSFESYFQTQKRILVGVIIAGGVVLMVVTGFFIKRKYNITLKRLQKKEGEKGKKVEKKGEQKKPEKIIINSQGEQKEEERTEKEQMLIEGEKITLEQLNKAFKG